MLTRLPFVLLLGTTAAAQNNSLVSVSSGGALGDHHAYSSVISADGRYVAFQSAAENHTANDSNGENDIFRHDLQTGVTELVSVNLAGSAGNNNSVAPSISGDGRLVAWSSIATDLVAGDTNGTSDVFLRDMVAGVTTRISLTSAGTQAFGDSYEPRLTPDGRFVTFQARAALIPADVNDLVDCYRLDRTTGTLELVSTSSTGGLGNGHSQFPRPSDDGRYVCFYSGASDLVAGDTNSWPDIFWKDMQTGRCLRVNVSTGGAQADHNSVLPSISGDGQTVTYCSRAGTLVAGDSNFKWDLFARDVPAGVTTRLSVSPSGAQSNVYTSSRSALSYDGRFVVFASLSPDLVLGDTNDVQDVFIRDRQLQTTQRVSRGHLSDQTNGDSFAPHMTPDASLITFMSEASNLVPGDTNGRRDIFAAFPAFTTEPRTSYCFGDGSGSACPCGNLGNPGEGCANSGGAGGATLTAGGNALVSNDTFSLSVAGVPGAEPGLVVRGGLQTGGVLAGDGLLCTSGNVARSQMQITSAGATVFTDFQGSPFGASSFSPGSPTNYQFWYRDPVGSPCGGGFNFTNGVSVVWAP